MIVWLYTFEDGTEYKLIDTGLSGIELVKLVEIHGKVTVDYVTKGCELRAESADKVTARVTIYDDDDDPKGAYELKPSRVYKSDISTKYVFEFEYNQLNYNNYKTESESK